MRFVSRRALAFVMTLVPALTICRFAKGEVIARHGQCFLENVDGLLVLHLKGTPAEMGYAHGRLMADKVRTVYQALGAVLNREVNPNDQKAVAAVARPHIPQKYVDEIHAIAAGANDVPGDPVVDPNRLFELHCWDEIVREAERGICGHFAVMGGATPNGHTIMGVQRDDEQAVRRGVQDGAVVIIYEPADGHTFCSVAWAGFAGVMTGMNSQGLAISEAAFPAFDQRAEGLPLSLQLRMVMEQAWNVGAAEYLLRSARRTVAGNVLVADGLGSTATRAFEFTANRFESFSENDSRENFEYEVRDGGVACYVTLFDPPALLNLPSGHGTINTTISRRFQNGIVRSSMFTHHEGIAGSQTPPLLELQCNWVMTLGLRNPEFIDIIDMSPSLPATYPYRSLDIVFMVDKIVSKQARDIISPVLAGALDLFMPGWEAEIYRPEYAALTRYWLLRERVKAALGQIDVAKAIQILGGNQTPEPYNVLTDPNTLHSVVFDATALEVWVATAAPKGTSGKPDANLQTYRRLDFAGHVTYPLTIQTTPVTGEVFVNGVSWGSAPQARRLAPGQYTVSFGQVAGYATPEQQIATVGPDGTVSVVGTYVPMRRLTITVDGQGSVRPSGGDFKEGTQLGLTAIPAEGSYFVSWTGDYAGSQPTLVLTIVKDTSITVHFSLTPPGYSSLTVLNQGEGTVEPASGVYPTGSDVVVTATPLQGWYFAGWTGDVLSGEATVHVLLDGNKTLTADFRKLASVNVEIQGTGDVILDPPGGLYVPGTSVTLTAQAQGPTSQWRFVEWRGDLQSKDNPAMLVVDSDKQIVAVFEAIDDDPGRLFPPCAAIPSGLLLCMVLVGGILITSRGRSLLQRDRFR